MHGLTGLLEMIRGRDVWFIYDIYRRQICTSSGIGYNLVFQQAPYLRPILILDEIQSNDVNQIEPVDLSNGLNCIRIYRNLIR